MNRLMSVGVVLTLKLHMQGSFQVETVSLDTHVCTCSVEFNSINLFICMVKNIMLEQC